MNRLIII